MRKVGGGGSGGGRGAGGQGLWSSAAPAPACWGQQLLGHNAPGSPTCLFVFLRKTKFKISDNFFFEILTAELKESCQLASLWTGFCGSVFLSSNLVLTPARVCPGEG